MTVTVREKVKETKTDRMQWLRRLFLVVATWCYMAAFVTAGVEFVPALMISAFSALMTLMLLTSFVGALTVITLVGLVLLGLSASYMGVQTSAEDAPEAIRSAAPSSSATGATGGF